MLTNLPRRGYASSFKDADHAGVVLYWRPGCRFCMRLRLRLRFTRLSYHEINIWKDQEAARFVRSVAGGNETVPTVIVAGRAMVNPSLQQLIDAVKVSAPQLLPAEDGRKKPPQP
ncbi:glutaredoxin domain-containing protein [Nonomuraea sediminis]|uniref:glutaredoxin domain-containing protein n=1 Tax=Nonomuraea sediminis TaxID=2835864 RepID=UPI0027DF7513|nr:glutaredoxin domain-containing protein [Nonomuraea sediminis]